jgi:nucleolar protein 16
MSVAKEASTSRQQRVELPLIPGSMDIDELDYVPKQQFGRIIRDADGNVIDIIIDEEDEETKGKTQEEIDEENRTKPLNDEESAPEVVLAKTDVVKRE